MKNEGRFFQVQSRKTGAALAGMAAVELAVEMVSVHCGNSLPETGCCEEGSCRQMAGGKYLAEGG